MNVELSEQVDNKYLQAEQRAAQYLSVLRQQVIDRTYVTDQTEDFHMWKKSHLGHRSWMSFLFPSKRKPSTNDYNRYMKWLNHAGKLDDYLDRSVSYIYMRDLGKSLASADTRARIHRVVDDVKKYLLRSTITKGNEQQEVMSLVQVYRWAQKEGIENAIIWVIDKLKHVSEHIPQAMNAEQAQRKLIKIIIGVILHVYDEMDADVTSEERSNRLDAAIRLGYSYGLTYPFIDDLLDSQVLNPQEKKRYSDMIRRALLTRSVPDLDVWEGMNSELIRFVHSELRDAFEYVKKYQRPEALDTFFEQAYVFFQSQDMDRVKDLTNGNYSNEELFLPIILKSSSSRLIVRSVISAPEDDGFEQRTFYYGIYNQLADDFADMFDDMKEGAVTPYTYYLKYHKQRSDLINPFELYWAVISNLIHHVYQSDTKTREVILDRAINGLKRCKERVGHETYNEIMELFASGLPQFNQLIQQMVQKADDVDFFDKLLRDQVIHELRNDRESKAAFFDKIKDIRLKINDHLQIQEHAGIPHMKDSLTDAANYSLQGGGKRLRPILSWVMGVQYYGLEAESIMPLIRSIEYMHTASLIFDDLPSQDNAATRRGRATLHQVHNSATAELTGIFLMQKAIEEQSSLHKFDAKAVLALMRYSSQRASDMCIGQEMDLRSKGEPLSLEQLNTICFYKTGIAFEASLLMPAILAQVDETEMELLKKYSYHAGIAFQIKDDLLDVEGDQHKIGKPLGQDAGNNTSTFVSILGQDGARQQMWDHYCHAMEALKKLPRQTAFLKHLMDYIINRDD